MTKHTPGPWHVAKTSNGQGLVIDEATGANVAVTYDEADAPIVAASPDLLFQLERYVELHEADCVEVDGASELLADARAAIAAAKSV